MTAETAVRMCFLDRAPCILSFDSLANTLAFCRVAITIGVPHNKQPGSRPTLGSRPNNSFELGWGTFKHVNNINFIFKVLKSATPLTFPVQYGW